MSTTPNSVASPKSIKPYVIGVIFFMLIVLMAFDTKVMSLTELEGTVGFSPQQFAEDTFPEVQEYIETNAVNAPLLAAEILQDVDAASERYGVAAGIGHTFPVSLTGTVIENRAGVYTIDVADMPSDSDINIRVQAGSAINGTTLRDTTGTIQFGDFTNQIEYQNAGAALNEEMKRQVLDAITGQDLTGETLEVVGSFTMINPSNWLITPVSISVIE